MDEFTTVEDLEGEVKVTSSSGVLDIKLPPLQLRNPEEPTEAATFSLRANEVWSSSLPEARMKMKVEQMHKVHQSM